MLSDLKRRSRPLVLLCSLAAFAACDSPAELDDPHPEGVVFLRADGTEAARFVLNQGTTGALTVGVGATERYAVRVLNEDGDLEPLDGIEYSITQPQLVIALAATVALSGDEIVLTGGPTPRNTTMFFELQHALHTEFGVQGILVSVQ